MPQQDLVDLRVMVNGQPLKEYLELETVDEGHERTKYIEVTAGQQFQVKIEWKTGFKLRWAENLHYKVYIDDNDFHTFDAKPSKQITHHKGGLGKPFSLTFPGIRLKNKVTGEWERRPPVFGALGISESNDPFL
jgi:hypothetical protein